MKSASSWWLIVIIAMASGAAAAGSGFVVGYVVGHKHGWQHVQSRNDAEQAATRSYVDSCQALSAAVDRSLEANRLHMLQSHGMAFIEGKGWERQ